MPLTSGLVAKRASCSPQPYSAVRSFAPARSLWASASSNVGAIASAMPARLASSAVSVRIAPGFLNAGASTFLSTIARASTGSRWLRDAVEANSAASAETILSVRGIGSAAPMLAPGAMITLLAERVTSAPAE